MSAKLVYSLTDDKPNLQKQMGCINGLFQLFDRHHSGRRANAKRLPPSGQGEYNEFETKNASKKIKDKNPKKGGKEKPRISTESSRTSFSSSTCSSTFSSLDCNKTAIQEPSSVCQAIFPETPSRHLLLNQPIASPQLDRNSLDIRDVVKDCINREAGSLSVKTLTNKVSHTVKHIDSPRPLQPSKQVKPRVPILDESFRSFGKLQGASCGYERKDGPRFSYDGRESRDKLKSTLKLKDLPRLSLDSKASSMRGSASESKSINFGENRLENLSCNIIQSLEQEPGSYKRPSSVVAKLMGLEVLPDSMLMDESNLIRCELRSDKNLLRSSQQNHGSDFFPNPYNEPISPHLRNADPIMKSITASRIPIEPALRRRALADRCQGSEKPAFKCEVFKQDPNPFPSVYGELEKSLADLQFKKTSKDLRALKQIVGAMQKTKEVFEVRKEDQVSDSISLTSNKSLNQSNHEKISKLAEPRSPRGNKSMSTTTRGNGPQKSSRSPIVVMKPGKVERNACSQATLAIPIEGLAGLRKLQTCNIADSRKDLGDNQTAKDRTPRNSHHRNASSPPHFVRDKNISSRTSRSQYVTADNHTSSGRSSGAISPRLQQKQLRMERQTNPTTPSSDPNRTKRQSGRQSTEAESPGRKIRPKFPNLQQFSEKLSEASSNPRCDSLLSDSNITMSSQNDTEVTTSQSAEIIDTYIRPSSQKHNYLSARLSKDGSMAELITTTTEQPSPVSVLDAMFYNDDLPSPVKKISNTFKDDEVYHHKSRWSMINQNDISDNTRSILNLDIDHKETDNIQGLVQNLRQLNFPHYESCTEYTSHLINNKNQDHRYVYEILSASGLPRNFGYSCTTIQLHQSEHVINPKLFLVLEQNKAKINLSYDNQSRRKDLQPMHREKVQRKLIFDVVDEILARKVALADPMPWLLSNKLASRNQNGKHLLGDLCSEIDQLQVNHFGDEDDNDDIFRSILWEDLRQQPQNWTDFGGEISWLVLDVERLIFKDLVSEVVSGETANPKARPRGHCRELYYK